MIYDLSNQRLTSGQLSLISERSKTLSVKVDCRTGYVLRADAVGGLVVEARRTGDASWTDIESGSIDLSAFNGSLQTYEIRLTAAATNSRIRRGVNIKVER